MTMPDGAVTMRSHLAGPLAHRTLQSGNRGRIAAVFSSVFYLEFGTDLIAVGHRDVDPGPLTLILDSAPLDWRKFGLTVNKSINFSNMLVTIPGQLRLDLSRTETWAPDPSPARADTTSTIPPHIAPPDDGYGRHLFILAPQPCEVTALETWLSTAQTRPPPVKALIGRGPGLTPAGDDFLGGTMIALHGLGRADLAQSIWTNVKPLALHRTNAVSRAMLAAAAEGLGSQALHRAMNAWFSGENLDAALAGLARIGHSSGWDAFAGVAMVTRTAKARKPQAA